MTPSRRLGNLPQTIDGCLEKPRARATGQRSPSRGAGQTNRGVCGGVAVIELVDVICMVPTNHHITPPHPELSNCQIALGRNPYLFSTREARQDH
jgi:hypothetical protein